MGSRVTWTSAAGGALLLVAGAVVATGVMPPVRSDPSPSSRPESAAAALLVAVFVAVVAAGAALLAPRLGAHRQSLRRALLGTAAFTALVLGGLVADAAAAFSGHGPQLHSATTLLIVCAGLMLAAVLSLGLSALWAGQYPAVGPGPSAQR